MMLPNQKYPNTSRIITGLGNIVYDTDVLLYCDTSLGAVELTLLEIPANFWNTIYTLRVIDISSNASTNNITINAPVGYTINNVSSLVINVNNTIAVITIASNTAYLANITSGTGSGAQGVQGTQGLQGTQGIQGGQGVQGTQGVQGIQSAQGIQGIQGITGGTTFTSLTYSTLLGLIASNSLIQGSFYLITDAVFINTTGVYFEEVPILLQAVTTNEISLEGSGIFLNADYQNVGDYSSVAGFVAQTGIWNSLGGGGTYVTGDVVIWNNYHFVNLTNTNLNTPPDLDTTNWSRLSKSDTDGYIREIDFIKYDVSTNQITYREDVRDNRVENNLETYLSGRLETFQVFQWGNNLCTNNTVSFEGLIEAWNNKDVMDGNVVKNFATIRFRGFNNGIFSQNVFDASQTLCGQNEGTILENNFNSTLTDVQVENANAVFSNNIVIGGQNNSFVLNNNESLVNNNTFLISSNTSGSTGYRITTANKVDGNYFNDSDISISASSQPFSNNNLNNCIINAVVSFSGDFIQNVWIDSTLIIQTLSVIIARTNIVGAIINTTTIPYAIDGGIIQDNVGTTIQKIDLTDTSIYDAGTSTLTIPTAWRTAIGEFWLLGATGTVKITNIIGLSGRYATKFINKGTIGSVVSFETTTNVTTALATQIVSNLTPPTVFRITSRADGEDSIYIRALNTLNGVEQVYVYQ